MFECWVGERNWQELPTRMSVREKLTACMRLDMHVISCDDVRLCASRGCFGHTRACFSRGKCTILSGSCVLSLLGTLFY